VKAIILLLKRTHWFKLSVVLITCLLFQVFPSCQKNEFDQDHISNMDNIPPSIFYNKNKLIQSKVKDVDGNIYKTVKIGDRWWMAENLRTTKYNDGTLIPNVTDDNVWSTLTTPAYCWYNNDESTYKADYGALYNWYAVKTGKLCPTGWHVPSDAEWTTLTTYLGGESIAGDKLKEAGFAHWVDTADPDYLGGTNSSGFTALPGGLRSVTGAYTGIGGCFGFWWSSTEVLATKAWLRGMFCYSSDASTFCNPKPYGFSVRCVKDK
jgi:uncharacterized protein (TIGR02145 family)